MTQGGNLEDNEVKTTLSKMLKELLRERLMAAADEIFGMFERTVASYEEQLCRAKEENERQRRQLEDVRNTRTARYQNVCQPAGHPEEFAPHPWWGSSSLEHPRPHQFKEEAADPHLKEENGDQQPPQLKEGEEEKTDVSKFPLSVVPVKDENDAEEAPECSRLHHDGPSEDLGGGPPTDQNFAPLSHNDDVPDTIDAGGESELPKGSKNETTRHRKSSKRRVRPQKGTLCCSVCGQRFSNEGALKVHVQKHTGEKPFSCSLCGKGFNHRSSLHVHMKKHKEGSDLKCSICGQLCVYESVLKKHMRTHTREKPFACSMCDKSFSFKNTLKRHIGTHTGQKPHSCSVCGKGFRTRDNLKVHMWRHTGEHPYRCGVCGIKFAHKVSLIAHTATHTGHKPFTCSICPKSFCYKQSLTAHMHKHMEESKI
ncbi:uncharacterized protein LOC144018704 [Festucalex cinctus]